MKLIARIYDYGNNSISPGALKYECANLSTHTVFLKFISDNGSGHCCC